MNSRKESWALLIAGGLCLLGCNQAIDENYDTIATWEETSPQPPLGPDLTEPSSGSELAGDTAWLEATELEQQQWWHSTQPGATSRAHKRRVHTRSTWRRMWRKRWPWPQGGSPKPVPPPLPEDSPPEPVPEPEGDGGLGVNCETPVAIEASVSDYVNTAISTSSYYLCPGESSDFCQLTEDGVLEALSTDPEIECMAGRPCNTQAPADGCASLDYFDPHPLAPAGISCCHTQQLVSLDQLFPSCEGAPDGVRCVSSNECLVDTRCSAGACISTQALACDDGNFCNGEETCDPARGCLFGSPPAQDDDPCTSDMCDETTQTISHLADPLCEDACSEATLVHLRLEDAYQSQLNYQGEVELGCNQQSDFCALNAAGEVYVTDEAGRVLSQATSQGCQKAEQTELIRLTGTNVFNTTTRACCIGEVL